ncbi:MAG TPA: outer membrane protein assembly factor BamC [Burkholderiaceae bacterium]|nr:outer membrane protein assembly factor BamC [Burkholderiaceae bacterium]
MNLPQSRQPRILRRSTVALLVATALAGCSSLSSMMEGDRVDYRSRGSQSARLEVPPDLTQLQRDARYQVPGGGSVSAAELERAQATAPRQGTANNVAPNAIGDVRLMRAGEQRWLVTAEAPEQVWPKLRAFWQELGFNLTTDSPQTGVMETDWAENRAKLPLDIIRRTIGRALDSLYSTGEMDRFRTRVERTPSGTEIYISHRGMEEVYTNQREDQTRWQPRKADPELEAEMLSRLMVQLGAKPEEARAAVANAPTLPPKARIIDGADGRAVQLDEGFDRAWRRVGLSLDRSGFTVEDRDRAEGIYYVRYVAPNPDEGRREPGLFSRWFGSSDRNAPAPSRYRVVVRGEGERTLVSVLDAQGATDRTGNGDRILQLLAEDLR